MSDPTSNVVRFRGTRSGAPRQSRHLMEAVYAAGSIAVAADDRPTRIACALLAALGLFVIEEIQPDGTARHLLRGEAGRAVREGRPWRVAKPAFDGGEIGMPEASGAFAGGL